MELEIGRIIDHKQGVNLSRPAAIVRIETEDDALLDRILVALEPLDVV